MGLKGSTIIDRIHELEEELERGIEAQRERFRFDIREHRIRFEEAVLAHHRSLRTGLLRYLFHSRILAVLAAPLVYGLIIPLVMIDAAVSLYQVICFPVYGIRKVPRGDFVVVDRHHLAYLNPIEKLNCAYCGYANGVLAYARSVAARSEEHWCPIKHARRAEGQHRGYWDYAGYGDAEGFAAKNKDVIAKANAERKRRWNLDRGEASAPEADHEKKK